MSPARTHAYYPTALKVSNNLFFAVFTHQHKPSHFAQLILDDKTHTLHHRSLRRFLALPRDMLWVRASTHHIRGPAVTRHRCRRWLEVASYEALKDTGFDLGTILLNRNRAGTRKRHGEKGGDRLAQITGTLDLVAHPALLHAKWGEVREQAGVLANRLKMICEKGSVEPQVGKLARKERTGK